MTAVAVDIQRGQVFWADQGKRTITRSALNGSNPEVVVNAGTYRAAGVRCCQGQGGLNDDIEMKDNKICDHRVIIHAE